MTHAPQPIPARAPILFQRFKPPSEQAKERPTASLEDSMIAMLRQHYPAYVKVNGYDIRCALNRAFLRFVLEQARGNQVRAAEIAGFNRNTLRRLIRIFAIDWRGMAEE